MDENEYKMILGVYQKKTHEMLAQIIALETRVLGLNNVVEQLSTKVTDQENLLIQLRGKNKQPKILHKILRISNGETCFTRRIN